MNATLMLSSAKNKDIRCSKSQIIRMLGMGRAGGGGGKE